MQMLRALGGAAVLAAASWAGISAAIANSAIAVGQCDRYGYAYGYGSMGQARAEALNQCAREGDRTCQIVVTVHSGCGALAVSGNCGSRGWAYAPSRGEAERIALRECINHGGTNCTIRRWVCDN